MLIAFVFLGFGVIVSVRRDQRRLGLMLLAIGVVMIALIAKYPQQ